MERPLTDVLSRPELDAMDAYWRAANYLSVRRKPQRNVEPTFPRKDLRTGNAATRHPVPQ